MSIAREKFARMMDEKEKLTEKGVKIRVIGNLNLLPEDLQKSIADAMLMTKDNNKSILNVAFAYTSRHEITNSIATVMKGFEDGDLIQEDLSQSLIEECLYTNKCNDVDLLVRTSGELRFSDFLLWQVGKRKSNFVNFCSYYSLYFRHSQLFSIPPMLYGQSLPYGTSLPLYLTSNAVTSNCRSSKATSSKKNL